MPPSKPSDYSKAQGVFSVQHNLKIKNLKPRLKDNSAGPSESLSKTLGEALGDAGTSEDDMGFTEANEASLDGDVSSEQSEMDY